VLDAGGLHVVASPAVLHRQVGLDFPILLDRLEHLHRAQAVDREGLVRGHTAANGAARPGAEFRARPDDHAHRRLFPRGVGRFPHLHDALDAVDGDLQRRGVRPGRGRRRRRRLRKYARCADHQHHG
jgi:hypothetical protein